MISEKLGSRGVGQKVRPLLSKEIMSSFRDRSDRYTYRGFLMLGMVLVKHDDNSSVGIVLLAVCGEGLSIA